MMTSSTITRMLFGRRKNERPPHVSARAGVHKWGYSATDGRRPTGPPPKPSDAARSAIPPAYLPAKYR